MTSAENNSGHSVRSHPEHILLTSSMEPRKSDLICLAHNSGKQEGEGGGGVLYYAITCQDLSRNGNDKTTTLLLQYL